MFFAKKPSPIEILNDSDDMLINLYRVIQNDGKRQKLIELLNETPYSRSIFNHFKKTEPQDEIKRAVRFFYLSKSSFCGDSIKGGFACPNKSTTRNPAMTYQNSIDVLDYISKRLRGVTIECLDWKTCIEKYNSESSLFFCDAPYLLDGPNKSQRYYGQDFGLNEHIELARLLHEVKGCVMFCHYEHPEINKLYSDFYKYTFDSFTGACKVNAGESKPTTKECLYTNSKPEARTRSLFDGF